MNIPFACEHLARIGFAALATEAWMEREGGEWIDTLGRDPLGSLRRIVETD